MFKPLYKERIDTKDESSLVNTIIGDSSLKKDLLGDSNENDKGLPTFEMIESQLTNNFYTNDHSNERFEMFSDNKYLLVDFKVSLNSQSIKKLFRFFQHNEDDESRNVLTGYITGIISKIHEISNDMIPLFLNKNNECLEHICKNIDNTSVSQFIISLVVDNSWIKETEDSLKKAFCSSGTFEMTYSNVYTTKSRNELFNDSSEIVFEEKMQNWKENLEKQQMLKIQDVIIDELKHLPQNLKDVKKISFKLFQNILDSYHKSSVTSLNSVTMIYQIICKTIDLLIENTNHDFPTCMNRFDKEVEPFTSLWETKDEEFYIGLFNNSEAKVTYDMFSKLMKELFTEELYPTKLLNLIEFYNQTVFSKTSFNNYLDFFLEECNKSKSNQTINITTLDYLSKIIICGLHFETFKKGGEMKFVQNIIDKLTTILELLDIKKNPENTVIEGMSERPKLCSYRQFILKIITHCFLINKKNFNIYVSTTNFMSILKKLLKMFCDNDRFIQIFYHIIEAISLTKHDTLINNFLSDEDKIDILKINIDIGRSNKYIILRLLKLFDPEFLERCENIFKNKNKIKNNNLHIESPTLSKDFSEWKEYIYSRFKEEIIIYEELDEDRQNRHKRKDTSSSMFSNNLLDDSEKFENGNLKNLIDSDPLLDNESEKILSSIKPPINDFEIELEQETEAIENEASELPVRRRKLSEDNIQLRSNNIRENRKNNLK